MTKSFSIPTHPLLHTPRREWDAERRVYRREWCSYCLHPTFVSAPEVETGRRFCGNCVKKHGFEVKEMR